MSRRKKVNGVCKLCGQNGKLSFEHVPPESAFNKNKYYYQVQVDQLLKSGKTGLDLDIHKMEKGTFLKKQGGIGYYSLCEQCNNKTGSWYASDYVNWAQQAMGIILKANNLPTLYYPTYFYPLRVLKQVITMFFSIRIEGLFDREPDLQRFILDKERRYLNPRYRIFCYYNIEGKQRYIGDNVIGNMTSSGVQQISELSFPPFGFVLTIDNPTPPDRRLVDITYFANYSYDHWVDHFQKYAVLPTHLSYVPGDYRTKEEIQKAIMTNANNS